MRQQIQPLAEVFGFPPGDRSKSAVRHRASRLCPFNNKVPNCTKDKAENPLGVCSIHHDGSPAITCPVRFREDWTVADDAASFFFPEGTKWTSLTEVRLNDSDGKSAGNIDVVLVAYDDNGNILDFGSLEVQAVYISGNVRDAFNKCVDGRKESHSINPPVGSTLCPDYLSTFQRRLVPRLLFRGGIFRAWGKKIAVALNKAFFDTLPPLKPVSKAEADMAWLIYDLVALEDGGADRYTLTGTDRMYTQYVPTLKTLTAPMPGSVDDFLV